MYFRICFFSYTSTSYTESRWTHVFSISPKWVELLNWVLKMFTLINLSTLQSSTYPSIHHHNKKEEEEVIFIIYSSRQAVCWNFYKICIIPFNFYKNALYPSYRWLNWGSERLIALIKITWPVLIIPKFKSPTLTSLSWASDSYIQFHTWTSPANKLLTTKMLITLISASMKPLLPPIHNQWLTASDWQPSLSG